MKINPILLINTFVFSLFAVSAQAQYQNPNTQQQAPYPQQQQAPYPQQPQQAPYPQQQPQQAPYPQQQAPTQGGNQYPASMVKAYMEGCVGGAQQNRASGITPVQANAFCTCTINEFQSRYTLDQFIELSQTYKTNPQKQQEFQSVVSSCIGALQQ